LPDEGDRLGGGGDLDLDHVGQDARGQFAVGAFGAGGELTQLIITAQNERIRRVSMRQRGKRN
jgi:hypothetical protein